ncbi:MAG: hypothetical protein PW789_16340 [Edaphobacter sp.]|uniref:hypothetical protein n=1 Tax=Edaphobacter sp. TaxID=1934404 RepID=UPI00239F35FC|nr:hypothetical protein [Edaphobacter sp.]MDE1178143.1 hypothetical protein [Edaphobacter sp.]
MAEGVLRWTIRSPSEQGWAASATKYDIHAEWSQFIHELLRLQDQSCFPANLPFFTIRRLIAESMPLPAAEVAFFLYSFGGTGYVDLVPGMELKLERPLREKELSSTHGKLTSVEAVYRVVSSSGRNVGLRQVSAMGRKEASISREQKQSIFDLPSLLRDKPALRLFLAEAGDHDNLPGIIAATSTATEMPELTTAIVHEPRSCPRSIPAGEACVFFNGTAVNLLSSIEINGKQELLPFGTSLGYVVDVRAKGNALTSFSLKRQLATGDYAEVKFAPTLDAIQQIVLLPGDLLRWK